MSTAAPELSEIEDQTAFNISRWEELCADSFLASLEHRLETDAFGHIVMTPPASFDHSRSQGILIGLLLQQAPKNGLPQPEVPLSTSEGAKAIDVAWISDDRLKQTQSRKLLTVAPEICIEVLSPSNTQAEIDEKKRLYFEAGAEEVWICGLDGSLRFFVSSAPDTPARSGLCPDMPDNISERE